MENEEMKRTAIEIGLVKMLPTTRRVIYFCVCSFLLAHEVPCVPQTWVLGLPKVPENNCICFLPSRMLNSELQLHHANEPQTNIAATCPRNCIAEFSQHVDVKEQEMWAKFVKWCGCSCFVAIPINNSSTQCDCSDRAVTTDDATNTLVKLIITK